MHFVEANILVGRDNDTQFDLVQITVDVAVISTIKFTSPSPAAHFAQVVYDSPRNMLWIAPFARGSLFALRYALKGVPPARGSVVAFDRIAEYPLEPVLSLALNPKSEDAELFFASPTGFSLARIEKAQCDALSSTRQAEPSNLPQTNPSKKPSPAIVKSELPEVEVSKGGLEDILKLLKKVNISSIALMTVRGQDCQRCQANVDKSTWSDQHSFGHFRFGGSRRSDGEDR